VVRGGASEAEAVVLPPDTIRELGPYLRRIIANLATDLEPGRYALVFWPPSEFFSRVELEIDLEDGHYHVPLLVSPYGCASYRGS